MSMSNDPNGAPGHGPGDGRGGAHVQGRRSPQGQQSPQGQYGPQGQQGQPQAQQGYAQQAEPQQAFPPGQAYSGFDILDPPTGPVPPVYAQQPATYAEAPQTYPADARGARRSRSGFWVEAARFARQHLRTLETKEFFKTSEFFLTLFGAIVLMLAAAIQDNFDAPQMWGLFTALFIAYIISRGIAKAGSNRGRPED